MFKCEDCGILTQPRDVMNKVVTERREKIYENKKIIDREIIRLETKGWEIKKEIGVCKNCYPKYSQCN